MAKELPFFKFEISEWMFGRIQKQPLDVQGTFINLCCKYWHKLGELTYEDCVLDFGALHINSLLEKRLLIQEKEYVRIKFLDIQLDECQKKSKVNSFNGKKSAELRSKKIATTSEPISTNLQPPLNDPSTTVNDCSTEEIRVEKKREEEKRRDLTHLQFFCQSETYQEKAIKASKIYGLIFTKDQIKLEAEKHDATFLKFSNPTFDEWMQYFGYYFEKLKKEKNITATQNPPKSNRMQTKL